MQNENEVEIIGCEMLVEFTDDASAFASAEPEFLSREEAAALSRHVESSLNGAMTTRFTAVCEGGLLRPTTPVTLPEGAQVEVIVVAQIGQRARTGSESSQAQG